MDNFCDFAGAVVVGIGQFLHDGWVHPHFVGFGCRRSRNQAHSRAKSRLREVAHMKTASWLGILLVIAGVLMLAYQGINYTREKKVVDMGPVHVTKESHEHIPLPPILGGLALVGGVVLLVMGARNKS